MAKKTKRSGKDKGGAKKKQKMTGGVKKSSVARTRGGAVQGEMKYFDTELGLTALPASTNWTGTEFDPSTTQEAAPVATPLNLFCPRSGNGVNQRIGKQVKLFGLKIRGIVNCVAQALQVAGDQAMTCRIALVQDMQTNIVQAQGEEIFTAPTTADAHVAINTFQQINQFGRFRVLKDFKITLMNPSLVSPAVASALQSGLMKTWKINHRFKEPLVIRFNNTNGGTVADIIDHSFHIIANTNNITLAPNLSYVCRANFKE